MEPQTEITEETKWTAQDLGPRQAKQFNEALGKFGWEAKTKTEITDHGQHSYVEMHGGSWQPDAAPILLAIKRHYGAVVTGKNYMHIVADINTATLKLKDTRPVIDKRTTPEERAERERIASEYKAAEAAKSARLATLKRHEYSLAETSKAVKQVLSVLFPATTFSVRSESYSMGNNITASWTDGPTEMQVRPFLDVFKRAYFDGMEDLEHHIAAPEWRGHLFDFTGQHVSGSRRVSAVLIRECMDRFTTETGMGAPTLNTKDANYPYIERGGTLCGWKLFTSQPAEYPAGVLCKDDWSNDTAADILNQMTCYTSKESPAFDPGGDGERDLVFRILLGEIVPTAPQEASGMTVSPQISTAGITVTENRAKNGIEIRFADKPERATLDTLKARGWHWSRFSKCWYAKASPAAREFAYRIAGLAEPAATQAQNEDYECSDRGYEDRCADAVNR